VAGMPHEGAGYGSYGGAARAAAIARELSTAKFGEFGGKTIGDVQCHHRTEFIGSRLAGFDLPHFDTYRIIKEMETHLRRRGPSGLGAS